MAKDRLHIGTMTTRLRSDADAAQGWARTMDRVMRGPLPRAMGAAVQRAFGETDGILRIRRLQVQMRLGHDPGGLAIAEILAREVVAALRPLPTLSNARMQAGDIRFWPDFVAYAADFVRLRLCQQDTPDWAFPDFRALRHLSAATAATEVLIAGGLPILAALARQDGVAALRALPKNQALRLLHHLSTMEDGRPSPMTIRALAADAARQERSDPAAEAIALLLAWLASVGTGRDPAKGLPPGAVQTILSVMAARALQDKGRWPLAHQMPQDQIDMATVHPLFRNALSTLLEHPDSRLALETALDAETPSTPGASAEAPEKGRTNLRESVPVAAAVTSPHAGIALILPLVAIYLPPEGMIPDTLRQIALAILDCDLATDDPALSLFFALPPDRSRARPMPPAPAIPDHALAGAVQRQGLAGWADLLLARFAAGLSGLQGSSRGYLLDQFLRNPGRIRMDHRQIHVRLDPVPLGIVLRMGGMIGDRGCLPHLDGRRLLITMEGM